MMSALLIAALAALFIVALPTWSHSRTWGYRSAGILGASLMVAFAATLTGPL